MNSFRVFFQKEWMELIRTKRLYIMLGIFAFFAMISPVLTRYMSEIIAMATDDLMTITVPLTTWKDSWSQFYSNISQTGGICVIFLFMSSVSGEKQSGSAALSLTKNLSHTNFIIAKFIAAAVCFTLSILLAELICFAYTYFLFGYAGKLSDLFMGILAYNISSYTLIGFILLASTLARSTAVTALLSFLGFILLSLSSGIPGIGRMLPGALFAQAVELIYGIQPSGMIWTFTIAILIAMLCVFLSIRKFETQEI